MNVKQLKEKLEDMDYAVVYTIWDEYCNQEPPKQWQLIAGIVDLAEQDDDVFKAVESEVIK